MSRSQLVCSGCGTTVDADQPLQLRCPARTPGDDIDHVLVRHLDGLAPSDTTSANPFVRYRDRLHSYHRYLAGPGEEQGFIDLVEGIDEAVEAVDGGGFRVTPLTEEAALAKALSFPANARLLVKNETGNVSGSHKARHLMGVAIHLASAPRDDAQPRLAIASCGNAALAAAVVARATERALDVFIPVNADPVVVERLEALGASLTRCPRVPGEAGDPCYLRFLDAVAGGAVPFTCQGPDNGLTVEGGTTLAYELVDALAELTGETRLDRVVVQVGGGALGSAIFQGLFELGAAGYLAAHPRMDTLQTEAAFPLLRAYERLAQRVISVLDEDGDERTRGGNGSGNDNAISSLMSREGLHRRRTRADRIRAAWDTPAVRDTIANAARAKSELMWPWESAPESIAHGILDDETYDWFALVKAMLRTGGLPLVADESALERANAAALAHTKADADHTGTSGLSGAMLLAEAGQIGADEVVAVFFTGARRG